MTSHYIRICYAQPTHVSHLNTLTIEECVCRDAHSTSIDFSGLTASRRQPPVPHTDTHMHTRTLTQKAMLKIMRNDFMQPMAHVVCSRLLIVAIAIGKLFLRMFGIFIAIRRQSIARVPKSCCWWTCSQRLNRLSSPMRAACD